MPRVLGSPLSTIVADGKYEIDVTLDLTFPDTTAHHLATSPIASLNGFTYLNYVESVGEIKLSIESPIDGVQVALQNKDGVFGIDLANDWQNWGEAAAVLGKRYHQIGTNGARTGTNVWKEFFRGDLFDPNANDADKQVTFTIIPDTVSPGEIVCRRPLSAKCPHKFKHAATCGYTGGLTTCNKCLVSPAGCDGRANSHRFGGFEHRHVILPSPPTGGGPPEPPDPPCPRIDQQIRVRSTGGKVKPKMAGFVTKADHIWHPILRRFYPILHTEIVKNQPIWETTGPRGIRGFSSRRHPVIRDAQDAVGTAVEELTKADHFLIEDDKLTLEAVKCRASRDTGRLGDVVRITIDAPTEAEKIYCWSDTVSGPFIVCHNSKLPPH